MDDTPSLPTNDKTSRISVSADKRATWGHSAEFFLSTLGYCVGYGSLWRFPYLCYRNGGGAFLIPYFFFLIVCGIPLVFMEMSIGQYAGAGPLSIWSICPLAKGLGIGMVVVSLYCCIYYNVIIMWTLYYLFNSFQKSLPWATCGNPWNTPECRVLGSDNRSASNYLYSAQPSQRFCNNSYLENSTLCHPKGVRPPYPAEEFWDRKVLSRSSGLADITVLRWDLSLTLLLAWFLVFLCLIKGIKSSGKIVYVTAVLPYVLLTVLLIQGALMDGSLDGIIYYMKPDFSKLATPSVWAEACGQIFFALGAAWGGLITMASYNRFNTNIYRFSVVVPIVNCVTALYAGCVIFSVLGYMAKLAGVQVKDIADGGPGLIFVAYPYAISTLPLPQLWAVLFFIMVFTVGIDSQFGMFETFTTCMFDEFPELFSSRKRKIAFTGILCIFSYILGLVCCTDAGVYYFQLMDWYIGVFSLLFISLIEVLLISYVYGADRLLGDIELMIGYRPTKVWTYIWKFLTPCFVGVMWIYSLITYKAPVYNSIIPYPSAAVALSWIYGVSSSVPIPAYAIHYLWKTRHEPGSLFKRIQKYLKPSPEWGCKKHHISPSIKPEDTLSMH